MQPGELTSCDNDALWDAVSDDVTSRYLIVSGLIMVMAVVRTASGTPVRGFDALVITQEGRAWWLYE